MSDTIAAVKRPFGVTLVAVLIYIDAFFHIFAGFWLTFFAPSALRDIAGTEHNVPAFWVVMSGILTIILGFLYLWLGRLTLAGSATAYVLINFLAIINIVFSLFTLPTGWASIVLNVLILIIVNTAGARRWLSQYA